METSLCEMIDSLLASVQEEVEDPDLVFKLRTARQLNIGCKDEIDTFQRTIEHADLDEETEARLQKLGYL